MYHQLFSLNVINDFISYVRLYLSDNFSRPPSHRGHGDVDGALRLCECGAHVPTAEVRWLQGTMIRWFDGNGWILLGISWGPATVRCPTISPRVGYHLVITNIAKIPEKWRFLAGKIIYFYGPFSMAMLNNQRVTKKKASPQTLQKVDVDKSCAGPQRVFSSNNIGWQVNVSSLA